MRTSSAIFLGYVDEGEHLEDDEGQQDEEGEREEPEVVLVVDPVADQGPADEIAAEHLHEHDRRARYGPEAVIGDQRQPQPEAAGEHQDIDGGRAAAGVGDPAPDEEGKHPEQQHPVRRQHAPGDLEGPGDQQDGHDQQQEARRGGRRHGEARARSRPGPGSAGLAADAGRGGPGTPARHSRGPAATV